MDGSAKYSVLRFSIFSYIHCSGKWISQSHHQFYTAKKSSFHRFLSASKQLQRLIQSLNDTRRRNIFSIQKPKKMKSFRQSNQIQKLISASSSRLLMKKNDVSCIVFALFDFYNLIVSSWLVPVMLDEAIEFLEKRNCSYEVIVVSDGSRDATVSVAQKYSELHGANKIRVLELIENRGKGGAVRLVRAMFWWCFPVTLPHSFLPINQFLSSVILGRPKFPWKIHFICWRRWCH